MKLFDEDDMRLWLQLVLLLCILALIGGGLAGYWIGTAVAHSDALEHHGAHYNRRTGEFTWGEESESERLFNEMKGRQHEGP